MKKAMSLILAGALCLTLCTGALAVSGFSDVPEGKWYTAEIREMTAAGYIDGYEDGTFRPDGDVSVAEFVTIVARCLGLETGAENGHWAGRQMANAYDKGWLDEQDARRTEFNEPVSRQLAAKILASALGLGQGGSGDILTGMTASLLAQGMAPFDACCCAVWLHGRAGDLAAAEKGRRGMTPTDLLEKLPYALKEVE